jgi:hypothetical protein
MRPRISAYVVALILVAFVVAALIWIFFHRAAAPQNTNLLSSAGSRSSATSSPVNLPPPNTKTYQSSIYHFSLFYPDNLSLREESEASNSMVLLFEDPATEQGFDIFMTPYDEPKITQARFLMDEPSGVMNDPQNITIDGAPATEFFSTNAALGASREIWFLHGSILYEVTAPQSLDSWLQQIMETWQFT